MKNRWDSTIAQTFANDPLAMRVYTSRLLGQEPDLVLHGGGNTSVKATVPNFFGDLEDVLYVKGSGWDLATIEAAGFAPVRLKVLQRLAQREQLSDSEMVTQQRAAMLNPHAPNPSVEAILHAIIPFTYVDHTHADAIVTITNTPTGESRIRELFGDRMLLIPYVMPGFILARKIWEMTATLDWSNYDGMILMNHGIFTFANEAREAYDQMIQLVTQAEAYLTAQGANSPAISTTQDPNWVTLATIRKAVSQIQGKPMLAQLNQSAEAIGFSKLENVSAIATRGPVTPDHVIRTKPIPVILEAEPTDEIQTYAEKYRNYFDRHADESLTCLDLAPRWAVWKQYGTLAFDRSIQSAQITTDIVEHTVRAIQGGEALGGWTALPESDLFEMEYWELEQAKLGKAKSADAEFQGKVALVTGAASGIGKACAEYLRSLGATVVGFDLNAAIVTLMNQPNFVGVQGDVTDAAALNSAVIEAIRRFGGLDILVSNAGIFPESQSIEQLTSEAWERSLAINLTSHQQLLKACIPFLKQGLDPAVVMIATRNVLAPGFGAAAYSVAKAGLTQLARVAALELAPFGIRVNLVHPDCVYDTGIWSEEVLANRASRYSMSVEAYKTRNLLKTEVTSREVAIMVAAMAGKTFAKTTGAQVPIDGGSDRVI
ncbi:MAG: bifunctional aldolase/short-chain dehydrogenase [Leptolyngbya sp. Prado105]|jgi:rhamnose utilization protein RhaD (predicted bifunctional aldolase and dehydrogenase)/NAD(P)-dependent dehydrogenase (short-subunit alcohol dehydrogenase family)|nr:bifunctional aldolase/short-chain dehydrogenase [Leptolyngbya sp. Prado105]